MTPLQELWDRCQRHDWYWYMSDDPRAAREGRAAESVLKRRATEIGAEGLAMFNQFSNAHQVGDGPGGRITMPLRPTA